MELVCMNYLMDPLVIKITEWFIFYRKILGGGQVWGLVYFSPWYRTVNGFVNDPPTIFLILI